MFIRVLCLRSCCIVVICLCLIVSRRLVLLLVFFGFFLFLGVSNLYVMEVFRVVVDRLLKKDLLL